MIEWNDQKQRWSRERISMLIECMGFLIVCHYWFLSVKVNAELSSIIAVRQTKVHTFENKYKVQECPAEMGRKQVWRLKKQRATWIDVFHETIKRSGLWFLGQSTLNKPWTGFALCICRSAPCSEPSSLGHQHSKQPFALMPKDMQDSQEMRIPNLSVTGCSEMHCM